jgi:hypothetical protein
MNKEYACPQLQAQVQAPATPEGKCSRAKPSVICLGLKAVVEANVIRYGDIGVIFGGSGKKVSPHHVLINW